MVMEYVEGHTLDQEIKTRGRFSAAEALETLTPIMSVLDTAHSMGVVHRDLKPENIMIGKPAEGGPPMVKLLDLGIAKMREIAGGDNGGNTALTMAGQVLGTPYYMSPEQWGEIPRDQSTEIDGRADIYSLALVFYEMILGRRCFSGQTLHELRREHVTTKPRPLHEVVANVPRGFSEAIQRATAKDRGDRQATAGELARELRAGLATAPGGPVNGQAEPNETITIERPLATGSDVNAPTIITIDATPTSPHAGRADVTQNATVYEPAKAGPDMSGATVAESASTASTVPVPNIARPAPAISAAPAVAAELPASRSKAGVLIGVGVVLVLLLALGAGGVWFLSR
jgi:serine/threonine-protein kinase